MKTVLILDANQRSALAATRSLGKKNVPIFTADETDTSLAGSSRYSRQYIQHPSALNDTASFIQCIIQTCSDYDIDMILPMTELTTILMLKHRDSLPNVILPFADSATLISLADKCQLVQLAQKLDIPVPDTHQAQPGAVSEQDMNRFDYPLVLKPGLSWLKTDGGWIHTEVKFAEDARGATAILNEDPAFRIHPYMLQSCVPGHGEGIFAIYDHGTAVAFFAHRRVREKPPRGGVSVLSQSVLPDPKLKEYARRLLDAANWQGVAMVEFRVDDDGNAYLMEINTRFWGSLQLAIDAGVDFPWLLYQAACEEKIDEVTNYKTGNRLRWLLGDVDSLYLTLRDNEFTIIRKLRSLLAFLAPHPFTNRHEVNRLTDMRPFIWELKRYIRDLL